MPYKFPFILGWEAAGIVHSLGKNVTTFKPGLLLISFLDAFLADEIGSLISPSYVIFNFN